MSSLKPKRERKIVKAIKKKIERIDSITNSSFWFTKKMMYEFKKI